MKLSDILYTCKCIAGILTIPIRVYESKSRTQSYRLENMYPDPVTPFEELLLTYEDSASYYCTPFYQLYGIVKHKEFTMILGPVGTTEYTHQEKRNYAFALGVSLLDFDPILAAMMQIPAYTPGNFLHLLLFLNFYFNGEKRDINEVTAYQQITHNRTLSARPSEITTAANDYQTPPHNTYSYEKEMLAFVREGDVNGLKNHFSSNIHGHVGTLSNEQIRHEKNLFIVATTLISRAALDGGLYEDETFELSDMYIRRCEELFSLEAILHLGYEMAMDFTRRVFSIDTRTSLSPLVASIVSYIRRNISSDLSCIKRLRKSS